MQTLKRLSTGPLAITLAMVALALVIQLGAGALTSGAHAVQAESTTGQPLPYWTVRPCAYEDSVNCAWNAGTMGNGEGHSFMVRKVPHSGGLVCVFYAQRWYARTHDVCERGTR